MAATILEPEIVVEAVRTNLTLDLMAKAGVSQKYLATRWTADPAVVNHMLHNRRRMPYDRLRDIAMLVGVNTGTLGELTIKGGCPQCPHCRSVQAVA